MKIKKLFKKVICIVFTIIFGVSNKIFASDIVSEVNGGGSIQSSKIGTGLLKLVQDVTGTVQWILPVVGVCFILFYIFKILTR